MRTWTALQRICFFSPKEDSDSVSEVHVLNGGDTEHLQRNLNGICGCNVCISPEEKQLFDRFVKVIGSFDPDILMGWEIQGSSLGFLAERAAYLGIGLLNRIPQMPSESKMNAKYSETPDGVKEDTLPEELISDHTPVEGAIIGDKWGRTHASGVHVGGRIVLNINRTSELAQVFGIDFFSVLSEVHNTVLNLCSRD
ncbi:DNA-directed DNA polymerase, family B, exonuclease domain [Dillenia turbinata]|uniref:DNA-directed DNA polymerase, family B, exonuclease domain n=1 Tax=Dillenia turbinata TaxID=194707 RepID=A0AAN8UJ79_9MAGN